MRKILLTLLIMVIVCSSVQARSHSYGRCYHNSSNYSRPVYLISSERRTTEQKFPDCDKHYIETETTINYYSDGTRRTYSNSTIYNSDGSVLAANCQIAIHIEHKDGHYFIIKRYKEPFKIIDSSANILTKRNYTGMSYVDNDRVLVKFEKKYGIIDLHDNIVVPIKYQKFNPAGEKIFITKLNGYYGILDSDNRELISNECEKIKPIFDTFMLKKYGKYGLADAYGYTVLEPKYDKIKKLGEYIIVKSSDKYGVYDFRGEKISDIKYKKIRLERNHLEGQLFTDKWETIENVEKFYPSEI